VAQRQAAPGPSAEATVNLDGAFRLVVALAAILCVLMIVRLLADATAPAGGSGAPGNGAVASADVSGTAPAALASVDAAAFLVPVVRPAPPLDLTGPDGQPVSLAGLRGAPVLVFFGYTHCPDVCPATIGRVGLAIDAYGQGARAIFVSVDPERDTIPWLAEFVRFMPKGFTAITGTPAEVRAAADDWGVRYARVETDDPAAYSMSHTADVFLVDAAGQLRATFPFGTESEAMTAVLREVAATTPGPAPTTFTPTVAPTVAPAAIDLLAQVVSSSVWAGGASPVILSLFDGAGVRMNDPALRVTAQLQDAAGTAVGRAVEAVAVQPRGVPEVSFVPNLDIPAAGRWRLAIEAVSAEGDARHGTFDLLALDPGGSAALGAQAPTVRTPTSADFGGDLTWVTTDPLPDPRLSQTATTDALAAGTPFVLVVDSYQFKVTPACGRALVMAKRLLDRWTTVPFIHHEPYRYTVVTTEPVLAGTLADPRLTAAAEAWGVGVAPWGVGSMPWIFIVDGDGIVRAKYQGVIGSADVDVILSLMAEGG
jgi:protein SCO1/2